MLGDAKEGIFDSAFVNRELSGQETRITDE